MTYTLLASSLALASFDRKLGIDVSTLNFSDVNTGQNFNLQIEPRFESKWRSKKWSFDLKTGAFIATYPEINFQIPELSLGYKINEEAELKLGRTEPTESLYLDSIWKLSALQSSFRMEPLSPDVQGLTGIHYKFNSNSGFYIYGLFSPVFIPDQNQSLDRSGTEISSDNPWASLPPQTVEINGSEFDISYEIQNDSLPELLSEVQLGAEMGFNLEKAKVSAFYFYRPSRQLSYSFRAQGTVEDDDVVINARVNPQFLKEHLFGLQTELNWLPRLSSYHGAYGTVLDDSRVENNQDYQTELNDYFIFSNTVKYKAKKLQLALSHIHFNERRVQSGDSAVTIDFNRFIHGSAFKIESLFSLGPKLSLISEGLFDYENEGVSFLAQVNYKYKRNVKIWSSLQLLHDLDRDENNSIFERFEGLDSFRVGVSFAY